jgi:hypothetical protein
MNIASTNVVTLFDPDDKYQWCNTKFDRRIFTRFTTHPLCLAHIETHLANDETDVHFFFPDTQIHAIITWTPDVNDTLKYIYCRDQTSIDLIKREYGRRVAHKIFLSHDLELAIRHVEIELLVSLKNQTHEGSAERDQVISTVMQKLDCLGHILKQQMTDQPSEEALERN